MDATSCSDHDGASMPRTDGMALAASSDDAMWAAANELNAKHVDTFEALESVLKNGLQLPHKRTSNTPNVTTVKPDAD